MAQRARPLPASLMVRITDPGTWWKEQAGICKLISDFHMCAPPQRIHTSVSKWAKNSFPTKLIRTLYFELKVIVKKIDNYILERLNDYFQVRIGNRIESALERGHKILEAD